MGYDEDQYYIEQKEQETGAYFKWRKNINKEKSLLKRFFLILFTCPEDIRPMRKKE